MTKPIIDLSKDWQQPTSISEDERFAGRTWKVFTPGALVKDTRRRSDPSGDRFLKIPGSLIQSANIAAIYHGQAMLLAHGQLPDFTKSASFKNPKTYNFYKWIPSAYYHDGHWLPLSEYVRQLMPGYVEPSADPITPKTKEYFDKRRQLAESEKAEAVRYECSCGRRHTQTVYRALGDRRLERCPDGGIFMRVVEESAEKVKYVCDCGKRHFRMVGESETPPERCPQGGMMTVGERSIANGSL